MFVALSSVKEAGRPPERLRPLRSRLSSRRRTTMRSFVAAGTGRLAIGIFLTALGTLTAGCGGSAQRRHDAALQAQLAADQQKANQEAARAQALQAQLQTRAAESQTLQQRVEQLRKVAE